MNARLHIFQSYLDVLEYLMCLLLRVTDLLLQFSCTCIVTARITQCLWMCVGLTVLFIQLLPHCWIVMHLPSTSPVCLCSSVITLSTPPPCMLQNCVCLLLPWIGLHGAHSPLFLAPLAAMLLGLLVGWSADGPVDLAEDVGFDGWGGLALPPHPTTCATHHPRSTDTGCADASLSHMPSIGSTR
jgi:hypothetical protein